MFPLDWHEWRAEWSKWRAEHQADLRPVKWSNFFKGHNFMADEILGAWRVRGHIVELSEVRFMERRFVRLSFHNDSKKATTVTSFAELNEILDLAAPVQGSGK